MKIAVATALIGTQLVLVGSVGADDPKARAIMERVDARDDGDNQVADMDMVLVDRRGNERRRTIRSFTKDRGEDTLKIMFFLDPPDVEGTGFLIHDSGEGGRDDDQWLYLPALKKTKRIASSGKSGSFMGSDFNYSDMERRDLEDFDFTVVKETEVRGEAVWIVEAVPRTSAVIDETGYEKSLLLVQKKNDIVVRAVRWVKGGEDLRYMDVTALELINDIWVPTEMSMTTKRNGEVRHSTVLRLSKVRFDQELSDDLFTVHRLEAGP